MSDSRPAVALHLLPRAMNGAPVPVPMRGFDRNPGAEPVADRAADRLLRLAFIDVGRRKLPFLLALRPLLAADIQCLHFTRRRALRTLIQSAGADLYPAGSLGRREYPIPEEALRSAIGPKLMRLRGEDSLRIARRVLQELDDFFTALEVDAIFVWNGANKLTSALAVHLARQRGIRVIFGEHGYLPGTMQLDPLGVNQQASITAAVQAGEAWLDADPQIDAALDHLIACHREGRRPESSQPRVPSGVVVGWAARLYVGWRRRIVQKLKRRPLKLDPQHFPARLPQLPERFVLVPLQVMQDSQLLLHSPVLGNDLRGLLQGLSDALASVDPAVVDPAVRMVVKLHPREKRSVQASYRDLPGRFPRAIFTLGHPLPELLARASAVVTVNSTVGFEAMLYDKPVVALGNNFYTAPGLVERVEAVGELPAALERALTRPVDRELRRGFLRYVHARFLVHGSYEDFSPRSLAAVAQRIVELLPRTSAVLKSL